MMSSVQPCFGPLCREQCQQGKHIAGEPFRNCSRVTDEDMPLIFPPTGLGPWFTTKVHGLASYEENQEIFCEHHKKFTARSD